MFRIFPIYFLVYFSLGIGNNIFSYETNYTANYCLELEEFCKQGAHASKQFIDKSSDEIEVSYWKGYHECIQSNWYIHEDFCKTGIDCTWKRKESSKNAIDEAFWIGYNDCFRSNYYWFHYDL